MYILQTQNKGVAYDFRSLIMTKKLAFRSIAVAASMLAGSAVLANSYIKGPNQEGNYDCKGGPAVIEGANNDINFTGQCSSLTVMGANNNVNVSLAKGARIKIDGANNEIAWRSPGKVRPRVSIKGANNIVQRGE